MTIPGNYNSSSIFSDFPFESNDCGGKDLVLHAVVRDIIKWIDGNLDINLRVDVITRKSGYTHWYFQRRFKEITGISIADYIRICRVINATRALITTDKNIMSIAMDNGFSSQQTFTRVYRHYVNEPPGSIRKAYCGEPAYVENMRSEMFQRFPFFQSKYTAH
jgi:AraC family transcriptional activator of mar-sox-rob regulon